jgi:hypothetical protein
MMEGTASASATATAKSAAAATSMMVREQIPYWIPKDIFVLPKKDPASSLSSCCNNSSSSTHDDSTPPNNNVNVLDHLHHEKDNVHDDDDDDGSSVWSTSTTSDLTAYYSHGAAVIAVDARISNAGPETGIQTKENDIKAKDIQWAVEATYNDLEMTKTGSSGQVQNIRSRTNFWVHPDDFHNEVAEIDTQEIADDVIFDPFLLHPIPDADDSFSFTEYYSYIDEGNYAPQPQHQQRQQQDEDLLTTVLDYHKLLPALPTKEESPCTPSSRPSVMHKLRRCCSDLGTTSTRTAVTSAKKQPKRLVSFHARMEMLQHQSQKPFRTVSRVVSRSVGKLHDRVARPRLLGNDHSFPQITTSKLHKKLSPSYNRCRRSFVFRRKNCSLSSIEYECQDTGDSSSFPELLNIDSEETGRTFPLDRSESMNMEGNDYEIPYPVQFLVTPDTPQTRSLVTNLILPRCRSDEDGDLRWLFARQQLPLPDTPLYPQYAEQAELS